MHCHIHVLPIVKTSALDVFVSELKTKGPDHNTRYQARIGCCRPAVLLDKVKVDAKRHASPTWHAASVSTWCVAPSPHATYQRFQCSGLFWAGINTPKVASWRRVKEISPSPLAVSRETTLPICFVFQHCLLSLFVVFIFFTFLPTFSIFHLAVLVNPRSKQKTKTALHTPPVCRGPE